jgi:alkanesulfonate monooxygenase SsuD/methylene tetrahydromethanopterin reductase-like flavin-dependent oxidoreductase (luciferase family)
VKSLADIDIAAQVLVVVGDDVAECRRVLKQRLALFVGGYGARTRNFYADAVSRYGYGVAAKQIQALYLGGRKAEAEDAVPDELVDELTLVGPRAHVARQIEAWKRSGVNTLLCWTDQHEALRILAGLA